MIQTPLYTQDGKEKGMLTLPESVFACAVSPNVIQQVYVSQASSARSAIAHTKGRGEVRGGGRKPHRQKGTGRARAGSIRSPIWTGGGVTFGPTNARNFTKKINAKVKKKALCMALSKKLSNKQVFFLDTCTITEPSTRSAQGIIDSLRNTTKQISATSKILIVFADHDIILKKSFRNIPQVTITILKDLHVRSILDHAHVCFCGGAESVAALEKQLVTT